MKYDNKKMDEKIRGDRDEILYFLKDFNVPEQIIKQNLIKEMQK